MTETAAFDDVLAADWHIGTIQEPLQVVGPACHHARALGLPTVTILARMQVPSSMMLLLIQL